MDIIVKDELRASVEAASEGKQTVLRTVKGQPTYMTVIPRMQLEALHPSLGTGAAPAFVVNGVEKSEIMIGSYLAVIRDGEALSLPNQEPATGINFDASRAACFAAGAGFHLLTNREWAAIALWSAANGHDVRGNTNRGRSHSHPEEQGSRIGDSYKTLTGSGPASWRHDGTMFGVSDMVGNVWEWVDGLKMISGHIHMPADNHFDLAEAQWPESGACIDLSGGNPVIANGVSRRGWYGSNFREVTAAAGFEVSPALLQSLLYPIEGLTLPGCYWADNNKDFEAMPIRGGGWASESYAGLGALGLYGVRSISNVYLGVRPAFIG